MVNEINSYIFNSIDCFVSVVCIYTIFFNVYTFCSKCLLTMNSLPLLLLIVLAVLAVLQQRSLMKAIIVRTRILNFMFISKRFVHHRPFSILKI